MENSNSNPYDDEEGILVVKHGHFSGFTTGISNQVKSVVRWPYRDLTFESEEWCVLGSGLTFSQTAFSSRGDSESCMFDLQGRIGGMLVGGSQSQGGGCYDVTYVTPMEWLLEDIRRHGYDVELL
ncbi:hypothetical protein GGS23DRAFT_228973 [Durotheca rogersii]|uniref:uncharacterized protein n=1 Tax=Durotheca rogersii TaxID=419775 RepID=UPI002220A5DD|nr:uncharacterized protein GGS23DRAFT_228973 [Durotheca rogersii]KAI5860563.1 hypothetical protein GGS23DRAFT_228973 [Durotheca rogersii]